MPPDAASTSSGRFSTEAAWPIAAATSSSATASAGLWLTPAAQRTNNIAAGAIVMPVALAAMLATTEPARPSQVFFGLMAGAILCAPVLPSVMPAK